jgi:hypothetical protein
MGVFWLIGAALAAATPQTGNTHVDAFLADIAAGQRDAAFGRIHGLSATAGHPNAVALVSQLVDKLVHCTFDSSTENHDHYDAMYDIRWHCPEGDYFLLVDPDYRAPRLSVLEFVSAETREQHGRFPHPPPPRPIVSIPPVSSDLAMMEVVARYLDGIRPGGSAAPIPIIFRLHFIDRREPDTFVDPAQLGRFLGPCRRSGAPRMAREGSYNGGVVVRWTCSGRHALDANLTTVLHFYQGHPSSGVVLAGPAPNPLPDYNS